MIWRTIFNYQKLLIVSMLTINLALSTNPAMAAHSLVDEGSGTLELKPTVDAGDATAQIEYKIVKEEDSPQSVLTVTPRVEGLENMENLENLEILMSDMEGNIVSLGSPDETTSMSVENLRDFDLIFISRVSLGGFDEEKAPSLCVLFAAELPHGQQDDQEEGSQGPSAESLHRQLPRQNARDLAR